MEKRLKQPNSLGRFRLSKVVAWVGLVALMYLARDVVGIGFPQTLFTVVCLAAFLTTDMEESLCVYVFTLPLTIPSYEILLAYAVVLFLKQRRTLRKLKPYNFLIILFLVNEFIVSYGYYSGQISYNYVYNYVVYALHLLIPVLWSHYRFGKENMFRAIECFITGNLLVGLVSIYMAVRTLGWSIVLSGAYSLGKTPLGYAASSVINTTNNRNGLAVRAAISVALLLVLLINKRVKPLLAGGGIAVFLMVILLTKSRTGAILLALMIVYWVLLISFKRGNFFRSVLIVGGLLLLLYATYRLFPNAWYGVYRRFIDQEDITNGRIALNLLYLEEWKKPGLNLLLGYGKLTYFRVLDIYNSPHNMVVDVLTCSGALGLICLLAWLGLFLADQLKRVPKKNVAFAVLAPAVHFIGTMAGQYLTTPITHMMLSFLLLSSVAMSEPSDSSVGA